MTLLSYSRTRAQGSATSQIRREPGQVLYVPEPESKSKPTTAATTNYKVINRDCSWRMILRGTVMLCANNQAEILYFLTLTRSWADCRWHVLADQE
jgi:hypothetical protein